MTDLVQKAIANLISESWDAEAAAVHLLRRENVRLRAALEEIKSDPVTAVAVAERALEGK